MKIKSVVFFFFLLSITSFSNALNEDIKVIENPSFEVTKSGIYHISKIELNKTETRIHIHNTFIYNWWVEFSEDIFIQDCKTGKKYVVNGIEGGVFNEHIHMPKSAEYTVVLIFPPLDKGVAKIDYNNTIYGVSLSETKQNSKKGDAVPDYINNWIDTELDKVSSKPLKDFESPDFFNKQKGRIVGYIKGYDERLGFKTGIFYASNEITRESYPVVIKIHPDGRFEGDLPLIHPESSYIAINDLIIPFYLEPGQTLGVVLDWNDFLLVDRYRNKGKTIRTAKYLGDLGVLNKELVGFETKRMNYNGFKHFVKNLSPEAFKAKQLKFYQKNVVKLQQYTDSLNISEKAKTILVNLYELETVTNLFDYVDNRSYEARKDTANAILKIPVPIEFYDVLNTMPLNKQGLLVNNNFSSFVNRFEYCYPFKKVRVPYGKIALKPKKNILEYFDEEGIDISKEERALYAPLCDKSLSNKAISEYAKKNKEHLKVINEKYKKELSLYTEKYVKPLLSKNGSIGNSSERLIKEKRLKDSVIAQVLKLNKSLVTEIINIRALKYNFKNLSKEEASAYWDKLSNDIKHPFLANEGDRMLQKIHPSFPKKENGIEKTSLELSSVKLITELPDTEGASIFKDIIAPYKGKILFVDFWATWCGPCVGGIERMKKTREKFNNNDDFEFVFITDEGSPLEKYNEFVKAQDLKNTHRVSEDDFNYLRELFKFNGIPRYVVINKRGQVINDDFPMYSFDSKLPNILKNYK